MNSVLEYTLIGIAGVVVATGVIGRAIVLSNRKKDVRPKNDSFTGAQGSTGAQGDTAVVEQPVYLDENDDAWNDTRFAAVRRAALDDANTENDTVKPASGWRFLTSWVGGRRKSRRRKRSRSSRRTKK